MSVNNLSQEFDFVFEPDERKLFLQEVSTTAQRLSTSLGEVERTGGGAEPADEAVLFIQKLTSELEQDTTEFSPRLDVIPLRQQDFAARGVNPSPSVASLLERFNFYLVHIPITLFPKAGYAFVQLDCIIEFNPGKPPAERPVAFQIFPDQEWQDVIRFEQGLAIGLNENLEFKVDKARLSTELPNLSAEAQAAIGLKAAGNAGLILGPFNYRIRRPKIQTGGRGNVKVRWRLDSAEYFEQEEPQLGVLLQVPKNVTKVDAVAVLQASRDFRLLSANLKHVLRFVRERTKNFFEAGAPKSDSRPWYDITAGI